MMKLKIKHLIITSSVILILLITSCAQVELNDKVNLSPYAGIKFEFDWGQYEQPDSMILIMSRIINTRHYVQEISLNDMPEIVPDDNEEIPVTRADATTQSNKEDADGKIIDGKLQIKGGEYFMLAISKPGEGVELSHLDNFADDNTIGINDLNVSVQQRELNEIPELAGSNDKDYIKWMDFNPNYSYVMNISPIYMASLKNVDIKTGSDLSIKFAPKMMTQKIKIPFKVLIEEGVEITNVIAEISGVVKEINAVSCTIDSTKTHRVIFKPQLLNAVNNTLSYEGEINVLGLFPSRQPNFITGPGILQLAIYTQAQGKKRIFHTAKNLYAEIREAKLLTYTGEGNKYQVAKENVTLSTDYKFKITVKQIVTDNEDGIDIWQENDNFIEGEL